MAIIKSVQDHPRKHQWVGDSISPNTRIFSGETRFEHVYFYNLEWLDTFLIAAGAKLLAAVATYPHEVACSFG